MAQLEEIEGVGAAYGQKLSAVGITTTDELLAKGATASGRKALAEQSGIGEGLILRWVNHADLYRVSGIGKQFAELLEAAGVDSVPELAQRVASSAAKKALGQGSWFVPGRGLGGSGKVAASRRDALKRRADLRDRL
jgi:predicted flap endonuclease-1-like 5' DNA nuclease